MLIKEQKDLSCPHCGSDLPAAVLVGETTEDDLTDTVVYYLERTDQLLGRSLDCQICISDPDPSVSRQHARLSYREGRFVITDLGTVNGTWVNDRRLDKDEERTLRNGDVVSPGRKLSLVFHPIAADGPDAIGSEFHERLLELLREMSSLECGVVVDHAMELLRLVSGVERSYLVGSGLDPRVERYLTPLDDPSLRVSRSSIESALASGKKVTHFVDRSSEMQAETSSIMELGLRRIWVSPVAGAEGTPIAAVYLDSLVEGRSIDADAERLMDAVVQQIGLALSNAALHAEIVAFSEELEQRVEERTRQLEESQALLIGQDRLATLGKLVAAIAHELNNPTGAMASMAQTLDGLLQPVLGLWEEVSEAFPDAENEKRARKFLERCLDRADRTPIDTRTRRANTARLERMFVDYDVPGPASIAQRLGRIGVEIDDTDNVIELLRIRGDALATLADRLYTFGRGLTTIEDCAANVARIVDGLKTYAHLDRSVFEETDIHRGIQATLTVLASRIPPGVRVETQFDEIAPFPHRPGELTQVWTNLVDNALLAIGDDGTLTIETHDEGDRVRVVITDDGPGISPEIASEVFELDVTSRGPGAGLGLGLPICRRIIEEHHGGTISFESRPGRTAMTVVVPKKPPQQEEQR